MSDLEKQLATDPDPPVEIVAEETSEIKNYDSILWKIVRWCRAEETGVERVTDDMKTNHTPYSIGVLWMAVNFVYLGCSIGMEGISSYGLGFWDALLTILFFNVLGVVPVAYMCTFGPTMGMRQMVVTRYFVGYQVMRLFAALNALICIGWATLNNIAGANLLNSLGGGALPPWAAVLVIAVGTFLVTCLGYRAIHAYEKWCWVPVAIIMFILIARIKLSGSFSTGTMGTGRAEAAAVLSYGAALFGNAAGWTLFACDYSVYLKKETSAVKLFASVYAGVLLPNLFLQLIGLAAAACTYTNAYYAQMHESGGAGGLIYAVLVTDSLGKFGEFCMVVLAFSLVGCNVACVYSSSLSAQAVTSSFRRIPRFFWALLANVVALAVSIPAYYRFSAVLDNFMALLSYFISLYIGIFLSEHFLYRRGGPRLGYAVEAYQTAARFPFSYAGLFAFGCGVAGAIAGMNEVWWTGPLARRIDREAPADIGFQLSFAFAFLGHAATRWIEIKYVGM